MFSCRDKADRRSIFTEITNRYELVRELKLTIPKLLEIWRRLLRLYSYYCRTSLLEKFPFYTRMHAAFARHLDTLSGSPATPPATPEQLLQDSFLSQSMDISMCHEDTGSVGMSEEVQQAQKQNELLLNAAEVIERESLASADAPALVEPTKGHHSPAKRLALESEPEEADHHSKKHKLQPMTDDYCRPDMFLGGDDTGSPFAALVTHPAEEESQDILAQGDVMKSSEDEHLDAASVKPTSAYDVEVKRLLYQHKEVKLRHEKTMFDKQAAKDLQKCRANFVLMCMEQGADLQEIEELVKIAFGS